MTATEMRPVADESKTRVVRYHDGTLLYVHRPRIARRALALDYLVELIDCAGYDLTSAAGDKVFFYDFVRTAPSTESRLPLPPAVNVAVIEPARALAKQLDAAGVDPERITATADGGVLFYAFGADLIDSGAHQRYVMFEIDEDGLSILLEDRHAGRVSSLEPDTDEEIRLAIERSRQFLVG